MTLAPDANQLGALALVVTDRMSDATGVPASTAATLSALYHFLDRPTVDTLRQVLGLTPSGTVRLVDRLVASGYVARAPGADGRSIAVTLTDEGRLAAERVSSARADVLAAAVGRLTPADRVAFERIVGTLLAGFARGPGATRWICRLCDTIACKTDDRCPVGRRPS